MDSKAYSAQGKSVARRMVFYYVYFLVGLSAFAYAWTMFVGPYSEMYENRLKIREKANIYIQSSICTKASERAQLEGYNECERSERVLQSNPHIDAFYELMEYLSMCKNGKCSLLGFNLTDSLWSIFQIAFIVFVALWLLSAMGILGSYYDRRCMQQTLPFYGSLDAAAAANNAMAYGMMNGSNLQQQQSNAMYLTSNVHQRHNSLQHTNNQFSSETIKNNIRDLSSTILDMSGYQNSQAKHQDYSDPDATYTPSNSYPPPSSSSYSQSLNHHNNHHDSYEIKKNR